MKCEDMIHKQRTFATENTFGIYRGCDKNAKWQVIAPDFANGYNKKLCTSHKNQIVNRLEKYLKIEYEVKKI